MSDSDFWSVDQLAARQLLADLSVEVTDDAIGIVATHFARNRRSSYTWAAERVHANLLRKLEADSARYFQRKSEEWTEGFCSAEQQLMTTNPAELLGTEVVRPRSKGQILRAMMREARNS
jgi:hypothetical protein